MESSVKIAAEWLKRADYVLVLAGAGMSVDSGLPDFRGPEGFWRAYPPFHGKRFEEMSNPLWFEKDPCIAWGFFGHRLQLYNKTIPHKGYHIINSWQKGNSTDSGKLPVAEATTTTTTTTTTTKKLWAEKKMFVFTSNVDGAFAKAGFSEDQIVECHGTGTRLQCADWRCATKFGPYPTPKDFKIDIDLTTMRAEQGQLPKCPNCSNLSRPNILMFDDGDCDMRAVAEQDTRYQQFLTEVSEKVKEGDGKFVIIEFGAGTFVQTIRMTSESVAKMYGGKLIRVNLREFEVPATVEAIGVPMGALAALEAIQKKMDAEKEEED